MDKVRLLPSGVQGLVPTEAALSASTMNRSPIVLDPSLLPQSSISSELSNPKRHHKHFSPPYQRTAILPKSGEKINQDKLPDMDIKILTNDEIMSKLNKILDSKVSTTSAYAPLITSQHQEDHANPRTFAKVAKGEDNKSHTILLYTAPNDSTAGNSNPETNSVREFLSSKQNTTNEKIKIKSYRKIRNKGIAVDCENEEKIQKLIDKIKQIDELKEKIVHIEPKKNIRDASYTASQRRQPNKRLLMQLN
ncbi:hypothetical protein AVEN_243746-1 [Araneus ventricosus]|uniref:Uncharacterized protein n=1 Tax=Araneus ventricosus TaxID=182803 RepID=A0A4Y2A5T9_ARAVE|nr:hypothetical protein AVEN_243746-1 [Araneus ventricosus]